MNTYEETDQFIKLSKVVTDYVSTLYRSADEKGAYVEDDALINMLNEHQPLLDKGSDASVVLKEAIDLLDKGLCNVQSSGYYGYISSRPLLLSIVGDYLASALNQTAGAWRAGPAATVIENQTLKWIAEFIGYTTEFNRPAGIITNGGTMANATALKLARDIKIGREIQERGLDCSESKPTIYLSEKGHFSISKSLDFLGLGKKALRIIKSDDQGRMDLTVLQSTISDDIEKGCFPICLVGTAGTTSTGAIDDLSSLAKVAQIHNMWFHVDAASAGVYADHPKTKKYFAGLDLADSVTIDPCKWLFLSFGIGCLLLKKPRELFESFKITADYWEEKNDLDFFQMSFPGTRQWRSLGLWMIFKVIGRDGYHDLLNETLTLKNYLVSIVRTSPNLELLENTELPISCFRVVSSNESIISTDSLNRRLCSLLNDRNEHFITLMDDDKSVYLRVAFSNPHASLTKIDTLIKNLLKSARELGAI